MSDWPRHITTEKCEPNCFGCKCISVSIESANERDMEVRKRDKNFARDAAAYRRLKKEGLQPRGVDKSAQLEASADHKAEVALGRSLYTQERTAHNRDMGAIV